MSLLLTYPPAVPPDTNVPDTVLLCKIEDGQVVIIAVSLGGVLETS